jgi:hypothetical protein
MPPVLNSDYFSPFTEHFHTMHSVLLSLSNPHRWWMKTQPGYVAGKKNIRGDISWTSSLS